MENVSSRCGNRDNAPRLRFPEFRGEWVEKKLGEIFKKNTEKNTELKITNVICNSAKNGLIPQREYFDKDIANSENINGYYIIQKYDFVYNPRKSTEAPYGPVSVYKYPDKGIVSPLYLCFRATEKINSDFYEFYFKSSSWHRYIYLSGDNGARHDRVSMRDDVFFAMPVNIPSLPEQKKIAAFFTLLDRRIQKQRQLVERLKTYKRGVSEAIFERKFGFPNKTNWKKIKIENLFSERCERAIGNEELLAVTINGGIQKRNEIQLKDNSSEDKSNYKRVHIGDIAYNTMRMWQGASGVSCYAGIVSPAYTVIVLKDKENQCIDFWGHYFKHTNLIRTFQKFSQGLTSDTWNLKYAQLSQINLYVPEYKEQCAIANFLHKFDSKISIEEKKLSQLSMLKNELLHRMFI
ncbi:restriction endonuclease subunit S [uncultured Treponema sp.]|uniref:restriction endonuclease subunit S n=1 Tax=uncultured Treponema sp. TaxID=162155 RepID=UPI0025E1D90C|nr:restriction endonuclease subunit S [uncultured Treponema sp.]